MDYNYRLYITEEMVKNYAKHSGDMNRLHTDRRYAAVRGFNGPIVHGMAIVSLVISKLVEEKLISNLRLSYRVRFVKPVEIIGKKVYVNILCTLKDRKNLEVKVMSRKILCCLLTISRISMLS